jgi:arylsulfatase A-like enzyme
MNFIYFNPDEMRADVLGCYGDALAQTPNIDRLAKSGVRFEQCHVQHTVCTPSRCSFMTGWYPHVRGHRSLWHCLRPDEPNTFKYLKAAGYEVHWNGKNDLLAPESFADAVTSVYPAQGGAGSAELYEKGTAGYWSFLKGPAEGHTGDYHRIERAVEFLKSRKKSDAPFILHLPIGYPHCPYTCPEPWYSMYDPDKLPPLRPADLEGKPLAYRLIREYRKLGELDDAHLRKVRAVYMGMVSYVDHMLGMILDALDETGLADDTTTFFFSDHGDWAGDYGLVEKWPSAMDDCLTRIPMVVRTPECSSGHVVREPVECFDIMPTTLELAGTESTHVHFARSMTPQLDGAAGDPGRAVFAEGGYDPQEPHCFEGKPEDGAITDPEHIYYPKCRQQQDSPESVCRATMIRTGTHKLVRRPGDVHELYDLVSDPQELQNVYDQPGFAHIQRELEGRMLDWYVRTADAVPPDANPRGFTDTAPMA